MAQRRRGGTKTPYLRGISVRDVRQLDGRTKAKRALKEWVASIERDCGGRENLSAMEQTVIELAARDRLLLDLCDGFVFDPKVKITNTKRKTLIPIIEQRARLADALTRRLALLGLKKREVAPTLAAYLRENYPTPANEAETERQDELPADEQNTGNRPADGLQRMTPEENER
jgi:hypothetical protein